MMIDTGVPYGPGYSAGPEPSSTVSAVPVSIPNAARWTLHYDDTSEKMRVSYDLASHWGDSVNIRMNDSDDSDLHVDVEDVHWLAYRLFDAASAIEAQRAETTEIGSVHESAAPQEDAPSTHSVEERGL